MYNIMLHFLCTKGLSRNAAFLFTYGEMKVVNEDWGLSF